MSKGLLELRAMAEAFADGPAPEHGEVVPAWVLHDFAKMVLPYLAESEGSTALSEAQVARVWDEFHHDDVEWSRLNPAERDDARSRLTAILTGEDA